MVRFSIRTTALAALVISTCLASRLYGQNGYSSDLIRYSGSFLEIPLGARAMGMGGAFTSVADDGTAFFWNPAGVSLVENMTLSGMYSSQYGSIGSALANYYFAGWSMPVDGMVNVSANWIRFAVSDIPYYDDLTTLPSASERLKKIQEQTGARGTFGDVEDAIVLGFARNFKFVLDLGWSYTKIPIELPVGLNVKYIHQSLANNSATGIGLDFGVMLRFNMKDIARSDNWPLLSIGAALKDFGGTGLSWSQTQRSEDLEQTFNLGLTVVQPLRAFDATLALSAEHSSLRNGESHYGLEFQYHKRFSFRAGLNNSTLSLGAGVNFVYFEADYAYLASSEAQLGQVHRLGLSFNFDKLLEKTPEASK